MTIRVAVVDDEALLRDGIAMILEREVDVEVVGQAANGLEAIELVRDARPDVVLMDIRMPEMDGLEATARIVEDSNVRVIILTTSTSLATSGPAAFTFSQDMDANIAENS